MIGKPENAKPGKDPEPAQSQSMTVAKPLVALGTVYSKFLNQQVPSGGLRACRLTGLVSDVLSFFARPLRTTGAFHLHKLLIGL